MNTSRSTQKHGLRMPFSSLAAPVSAAVSQSPGHFCHKFILRIAECLAARLLCQRKYKKISISPQTMLFAPKLAIYYTSILYVKKARWEMAPQEYYGAGRYHHCHRRASSATPVPWTRFAYRRLGQPAKASLPPPSTCRQRCLKRLHFTNDDDEAARDVIGISQKSRRGLARRVAELTHAISLYADYFRLLASSHIISSLRGHMLQHATRRHAGQASAPPGALIAKMMIHDYITASFLAARVRYFISLQTSLLPFWPP